jgi:hypothetical protein
MRRKSNWHGPRPVVEITPTESHLHTWVIEGRTVNPTLPEVVGVRGYKNVEDLTPEAVERIVATSRLKRDVLDEAARLHGVYVHDADSVLFIGDKRWT